jgi:hypothetical protein
VTLTAITNQPPPTLGNVLRAFVYYFLESGDATPIMVGNHYAAERGVGIDARILLVPEVSGDIGASVDMGHAASLTHACDVHVRAAESGDDVGRYDAAYALFDKAISAVRRTCTGHLELKAYRPSSQSKVDGFGAQVSFTFMWRRDVRKDAAIWAVPSATAEVLARFFPDAPQAVAGTVTIANTTAPEVS